MKVILTGKQNSIQIIREYKMKHYLQILHAIQIYAIKRHELRNLKKIITVELFKYEHG